MNARQVILSPAAALVLSGVLAAQPQPASPGVVVTLYTPQAEQLELALDELELDWTDAGPSGRVGARAPTAVADTTIVQLDVSWTLFSVTEVSTPDELAGISRALEGANPGAESNFVLYEPGVPRNAASRRVLTTHVGLMLESAADPTGVIEEYAARNPQPIKDVPGGYLIEAGDPLNALQIAAALRDRVGVKTAYSLLKRRQFPR